jgi:hypothetical protein
VRSPATATKSAAHAPIERALPSFAPEAIFEVADAANSRSEIGELDHLVQTRRVSLR